MSEKLIAPVVRVIDCPRCHEQCGWCADPRWFHGTLKLPGTRLRCDVKHFAPEGDACPMCGGSRRVTASTTFASAPSDARAEGPAPPQVEGGES